MTHTSRNCGWLVISIVHVLNSSFSQQSWFSTINKTTLRETYQMENFANFPGGPVNLNLQEKDLNKEVAQFKICQFGMIPWKHCHLILRTVKYWLPAFLEASSKWGVAFNYDQSDHLQLRLLWYQFASIWDLLGSHDDKVRSFTEKDLENVQQLLDDYASLLQVRYASKVNSHYAHIIVCHLVKVS